MRLGQSFVGEVAKSYYQPAPKISKRKFHLVLPEVVFFNFYPSMNVSNGNQRNRVIPPDNESKIKRLISLSKLSFVYQNKSWL